MLVLPLKKVMGGVLLHMQSLPLLLLHVPANAAAAAVFCAALHLLSLGL
jgi:hypothetical protein